MEQVTAEQGFQREERYIVIKRKRLTLEDERAIRQVTPDAALTECVVVESDWPEYEAVWKMIEDRMSRASSPAPSGLVEWLQSIVDADWDEVVADGGVTAAMVIQQEAREQLRRLQSTAPAPAQVGEVDDRWKDLAMRAIDCLHDVELETDWGQPLFGPSVWERLRDEQNELLAALTPSGTAEGGKAS